MLLHIYHKYNFSHRYDFLSDPGIPGVRSMGPSVSNYTLCKLYKLYKLYKVYKLYKL